MDIGKIISELLYSYNTVTIPGFGGLSLHSRSVETDQVAGVIYPPSKRVTFNPNLVLDDGLLSSQIRERYQVPQDTADQLLENYVNSLKIRLGAGESIEIEQIGHFFQGGDQIQFSAAPVNYDKEAYGLPSVQSTIIARPGEKVSFEETKAEEQEKTTTAPREYSRTLQWIIPVLAVVALALIFFAVKDGLFSNQKTSSLKEDLEERIPINERPTEEYTETTDAMTTDNESEETRELENIEAPTYSPSQRVKKVIVGAFTDRTNAEKLIRKIQLAGYTPLSENRNGKRYVGITYAYETEAEFKKALSDIKRKFNKDAWILTE